MNEKLINLIDFLIKGGINSDSLDRIAGFFKAEAASIVVLKDFDITFASVSSFFKERSINIVELYKQTKFRNVYFEKAIKSGFCIVNDYQSDRFANPLWKEVGIKSVLLYKLDTEFNSVIAIESFKDGRRFDSSDIDKIRYISPFISRVLENTVYRGILEEEVSFLDIKFPESRGRESLRNWIKKNLIKIMDHTKAKAVSLVYPKFNIYSFIANSRESDFVRFKRDDRTDFLLTYSMFRKRLKAPAVFVYGLSETQPACLRSVYEKFGVRNILVIPIWNEGELEGVFGYGYQSDVYFSIYDVNMVRLVTKRLMEIIKTTVEFGRLRQILTESEEEIINSFVLTIEMRDVYTKGHSQRVAFYAKRIAVKMGLNPKFIDKVYAAGLLHDIGKIGIPDFVLLKPSKLSNVEYEMIKYHPILSHKIVSQLKSLSDLKTIATIVRHHHERCDGNGYPDGLVCSEISRGARILAIADVFDALTTSRPYRGAFTPDEAIEIMSKDYNHFDNKILTKVTQLLKESFEVAQKLGEESLIPKFFNEFKMRFSHIDSLTGLLSRSVFLKKVDELILKGDKFKLYMIDVKNMDLINIKCGNEAGDLILIKTAELIKGLSNYGCEYFARYGGDSFVFVVREKNRLEEDEKIVEFLESLPDKILEDVGCVKSFVFTVVNLDSSLGKNALHLVYLLRKKKNYMSRDFKR